MTADALYLRISADQDGLEAGVDRQREETLALAHSDGVEIEESMIFVDNDISASTLSIKTRPNWDRLIDLMNAGQVSRVWAYSNSRLTRRPRELEDLLEIHKKTGVEFRTVKSGRYDMSTADGRMQARILAGIDAGEAERVSERVTAQKRQRALQGKPQGGRTRLYGYTSTWEPVPDEATVIKEVFTRRAAKESINSIALDLSRRGVTTSEFTCKWHTPKFEASGKDRPEDISETREGCDKCRPGREWKTGSLLTTLRNPTYAGLRSYKGEVVGKMREGFAALIDEDTFNAAQQVSADQPKSTNTRRYLLSGFARCGKCMGRMVGASNNQRAPRYRCSPAQGGCGGLSIRQDWVDEPVYMAVVAYELSERHNSRDTTSETDHQGHEAEADRIREDIKDLKDGVTSGAIRAVTAMSMISDLENELSRVQSASRKSGAASAHDQWFGRTTSELLNLSLGEKRALMSRHIEFVRVDPTERLGSKSMDLSRVEIHYADGTIERLSNSVDSDPTVNDLSPVRATT